MPEGSVLVTACLPRPWPPTSDLALQEWRDQNVRFFANASGRLCVDIGSRQAVSRPVALSDNGRAYVTLAVTWDDATIDFYANGILLAPADSDDPLMIEPFGSMPETGRIFLTLAPTDSMPLEERHFVETLLDIDERLERGTSYEVTKVAGMLRLLLVDGTTLVSRANRVYRLPIRFRVNASPPGPRTPSSAMDWTVIEPPSRAKSVSVDIRPFLVSPALWTPDRTYSVRDVIQMCSNSMGGVHVGSSTNAEERALFNVDGTLRIGEMRGSLLQIQSVGRVVLLGLRELAFAIEAAHP